MMLKKTKAKLYLGIYILSHIPLKPLWKILYLKKNNLRDKNLKDLFSVFDYGT